MYICICIWLWHRKMMPLFYIKKLGLVDFFLQPGKYCSCQCAKHGPIWLELLCSGTRQTRGHCMVWWLWKYSHSYSMLWPSETPVFNPVDHLWEKNVSAKWKWRVKCKCNIFWSVVLDSVLHTIIIETLNDRKSSERMMSMLPVEFR